MEPYTIETAYKHDEYHWKQGEHLKENGQPQFKSMEAYRLKSTYTNIHHHWQDRPEFTMNYNDYQVGLNRKTNVKMERRALQFSLNLCDLARHHFIGIKELILGTNQCNYIVLPYVNSDTFLQKGQHIRTFDLFPKSVLVDRLYNSHPQQMEPLIRALISSTGAIKYPEYMNTGVLISMQEAAIRAETNTDYPDEMLIDKNAQSILVNGLYLSESDQCTKKEMARFEMAKEISIRIATQIEQYHDLEAMLEATLPSRMKLAEHLATNRTTLNFAVKKYLHKTIFAYWEELQIDKLLYMCTHEKEQHINSIINGLKSRYLEILSKKFGKYGGNCQAFIKDNRIISPFPNYNF